MVISIINSTLTSFYSKSNMSSFFNISVGCRVEGAFGPLVPNSNPKVKRRVREKVCRTVIRAVGQRGWEIVCDLDDEMKIFTSNSLKVILNEFGIPLHELVSFFITNL